MKIRDFRRVGQVDCASDIGQAFRNPKGRRFQQILQDGTLIGKVHGKVIKHD